jgi:hypothetical protein
MLYSTETEELTLRRFNAVALILLCLAPSMSLHAQSSFKTSAVAATQITLGQSIFPLNGPWKFHVGDSPKASGTERPLWATPGFDDSQWETVDLTPEAGAFDPTFGISGYVPGWTAKGHPDYWGYAWYRIRVRVDAQRGKRLALEGPSDVDDAYQVFVDGTSLGSFGDFRGEGRPPIVYSSQPRIFRLPQSDAGDRNGAEPATQVVAFRVWMEQNTLQLGPDGGGFHTAPQLGEASVVEVHYRLAWLELVRAYFSSLVLAVLFFLLAIVACSLTLFDRSDRVYLWLAAVFLLTAIAYAENPIVAWAQVESLAASSQFDWLILAPLELFVGVMVWWVWFRLRYPAWMPKVIAGMALLHMVSDALGRDLFSTVIPHPISAISHLVSVVIRLLFMPLLIFIVFRGARAQGRDGWLVLPAVVLQGISQFSTDLNVLHVHTIWFPFGVQVALGHIANLAFAATMLALLLRRVLLSVRRQREMALDVKQAQEVQHVLLPETVKVPGLTIESEYRPAREVGGDFFQIVPHTSDGSVLIVAGDVAGKGLQAGMLVAMLVGAIRTAAETSVEPEFVLAALNRRLLGRGSANATCLALRIEPDGGVTLANAGGLPPYLNGVEVPMEGALPLGTIPEAEFPVSHFQLGKGDTLTLISDGIIEAQDKKGHLFGFERVNELLRTRLSAAALATAAQLFGQEDDISVVSVTRSN